MFRLTSVVWRPLTPAYSTALARQVKRPHRRANKKKPPLCLIQLRADLARPRGAGMAGGFVNPRHLASRCNALSGRRSSAASCQPVALAATNGANVLEAQVR